MNPPIGFEAKTDRELLLLVAQNSNTQTDKLTDIAKCISDHEKRLDTLEREGLPVLTKKGGAVTAGIAMAITALGMWLAKKLGLV